MKTFRIKYEYKAIVDIVEVEAEHILDAIFKFHQQYELLAEILEIIKQESMKTYVLIVSRTFPKYHKRAGEYTNFVEKIEIGLDVGEYKNLPFPPYDPKIHTLRSNYEYWAKIIKEVQEGKAILSLRYWSDKPYNSKQVEFCKLDKDSEVGIQILSDFGKITAIVRNSLDDRKAPIIRLEDLAKNDGLSFEDFKDWFKKYDLSKPMAIIHFTNFRY